ncbi:DUF4157 domain-containing protein [Streptomyces sp. NPDC050400]|uniref:eCIS core domain-containing protein n=1 Tax=Streptomyces sp. NPDC050400 TaxID=3365610 RepID=UPI0037981D74
MSSAQAQDARAEQSAEQRRKKRKERAARNRAPEPKDIVSGAGQPLDAGVRRELEEQLGHDFGRVRLHTDRDAGVLTDLLGADAVAVGQDIFFGEGAYRPGTTDGQRLLAHELLHTVQNPDGLGALRAGRDWGAVSTPQQAVEREAESTAQELVRSEEAADPARTPEVVEGQASPGWMRYATVDADRMRAEQLDPETVVDRLVNGVLRSLRGDPADASGRARLQLARMPAELQDAVLDGLEIRLPTPEHDKLLELVDGVDQEPLPAEAAGAPYGVDDALEGIEQERRGDQDAWRARLEQADELESERIRAAQRRKAEHPGAEDAVSRGAEDGASKGTEESANGTGGPAAGQQAGAAPRDEQKDQAPQEAGEAKPLQKEGGSEAGAQGPGAAGEKNAAQQGEPAPGQNAAAQSRRVEDKKAEPSARQAGATKPAPVDKSAAERSDTRAGTGRETDGADGRGPEDESTASEEGGESEALAELEELLAGAEAEEDDAGTGATAEQEPPTPEGADATTEGALNQPVGKDQRSGAADSAPTPGMTADDVEALSSSLDGMDEEAEAEEAEEAEEGPGDSATEADPDGDPAAKDTDDAAQAKGEAVDRGLASETGQEQGAAAEGAGPGRAPAGRLAKARDDAQGQDTNAAGGGPAGGGGSGGGAAAGGKAAPAKAVATTPAASTGPAPAASPAAGGDTGVTPVAEETRSAVPRAEDPPKHQPARQDDDTPVSVKAAPRSRGGGGGGGGARGAGGGARGGAGRGAAKPKKGATAPNVSNATPEAGLSAAANLKPHLALTTLKGVDGAVGRSVAKDRGELKDAPPTMDRPVGSPKSLRGGPKPSAPGSYTSQRVGKTDAAQGDTPEIKGEKTPSGELPAANMDEPSWWDIGKALFMGLGKKLLSKLLPLDKLTGSIDDVPTTDKGLQGTKVGDAPKLPLKDDSDPERTDKQARLLDDKSAELHESGRDDAARPMGEDEIFPDVPQETLTAKVGGGGKRGGDGGGPAGAPGAGLPVEAVSAVAEHEQGPQIKQAFGQARQKMATARREKETKAGRDRRQYQRDVKREIDTSTQEQASARSKGRSDIARSRAGWRKEQDDKLGEVDGKKGKQFTKARKDIKEKQDKTDQDVDQRTKDDQKKIDDQRTGSEKEVVRKRDDGKKDSRNWFEKGLDWIKEQFTKLKKAIKDVFEKARNLVKGVIEDFKKQVFKFIDDARKWVIGKINEFADALIRLGDELLKDYPAMRDKWRKSINGLRDAAVKKVNQFADKLKKIAGRLIDAFGDMLLAGLDLLEKGLLAAVSVAEAVTVKAMELGAALLKGLGEWAAIATDILSDPGGWISSAKDAAVTGAKEHLFTEIKAAVKEWFNQKVQQLIGIPMEMFNRLVKGGTSKEEMAKMAWDEALPQLPMIIGELIVTKVVAKLIPGAGWVMAVIDALKTAYDALSSVLRAFGLFMSFLKAVKGGNGALPFAKAVASGVVALLELIYQWLVSGVGKYLGKVAKALRGKASKLGKKGPGGGPKKNPEKGPEKDPKSDPRSDPKSDPKKDPKKDSESDPKKRPDNDPDKAPDTDPKRDPKKDESSPAKDGGKDRDKGDRDDDRVPDLKPRPTKRTDPKDPDGRGPRSDRKDSRRPGDKRPDGKRPTDKKPGDKRPDLTKSKDKHPDGRKPARNGKRPNKDAPGQKRKPADKGKQKKPSLLSRARNAVKNVLAKVRRALRRLGNRARQLLNKLKNFARRLKELWRRIKDRLSRQRRDKDDRSRKGRKHEPTRDYAMPTSKFVARNGERHKLSYRGRGRGADLIMRSDPEEIRAYLESWRKDIEPQRGTEAGRTQAEFLRRARAALQRTIDLQKKLPPTGTTKATPAAVTAARLLGVQLDQLASLLARREKDPKPPLLPTVIPEFTDGHRASGFEATGINKDIKRGEVSTKAKRGNPIGWDTMPPTPTTWVRMHLLTEKLQGTARGTNLVPAPGPEVNTKFHYRVEGPAHAAVAGAARDEDMIWYRVNVSFHSDTETDPNYGYPKVIGMQWGGYDVKDKKWVRKPTRVSYERDNIEIPGRGGSKFNINGRSPARISKYFGVGPTFAKAVVLLSPYKRFGELRQKMTSYKRSLPSGQLSDFVGEMRNIESKKNSIRYN